MSLSLTDEFFNGKDNEINYDFIDEFMINDNEINEINENDSDISNFTILIKGSPSQINQSDHEYM